MCEVNYSLTKLSTMAVTWSTEPAAVPRNGTPAPYLSCGQYGAFSSDTSASNEIADAVIRSWVVRSPRSDAAGRGT
jgi:hypothetical protein